MTKLLLWVLWACVAWMAWRVVQRRRSSGRPRGRPTPAGVAPEAILACARCGVHVPQSAALMVADRVYCSTAHRDEGERARAAAEP